MSVRLDAVDNVKKYMTIPAAETFYDNDFGAMVEDASAECETYCGRTFTYTAYINDIYHAAFGSAIALRNFPVDSAAQFVLNIYNGVSLVTVDTTDYVVDYVRGIVRLRPGVTFSEEPDAIQVSYSAGFQSNGLTGTAQAILVPNGLSFSIRKLVANRWRNQQGSLSEDDLEKIEKNVHAKWEEYSRKW